MKAIAAVILAVLVPATGGYAAGSVFDRPITTGTKPLAGPKTTPPGKLTCRYFPRFMVKEIDDGEIGAAQLSIIPYEPGQPPNCQRKTVSAEKVINPDAWSGYVKGVKGDYVFFDAEDGVNGALGFAVFSAQSGKKLFEDSALGDLQSLIVDGPKLILRYKKSFAATCSVPHDGEACWRTIAAASRLDAASKPDCAGGYLKAKTEMAKARCDARTDKSTGCPASALKELDAQHWDDAPSVVVYDAETVLEAGSSTTKPVGNAEACHPSD